jgi:hypothetical protein
MDSASGTVKYPRLRVRPDLTAARTAVVAPADP